MNKIFISNFILHKKTSRSLFMAYIFLCAACSLLIKISIDPSRIYFINDIYGIIDYFFAKGRDKQTSNAIFFSASLFAPISLASWHFSYLAGRDKKKPPNPWMTVAGIVYATPLIYSLLLFRPQESVKQDFSNPLLNIIIINDILYFFLITLIMWTISLFLHMSSIYPLHKLIKSNK